MSDVLVIAGNELDLGFRLAGVTAVRVKTAEEGGELLDRELQKKERPVIIVDSGLLERIPARIRREARQSVIPMVLAVPMEPTPDLEGAQAQYVQGLVREAVGFAVKI